MTATGRLSHEQDSPSLAELTETSVQHFESRMGFHRHFPLERDPKIQEVVKILHQQGVPHNFIVLENISAALQSNYANGDVKKKKR